MHRLQPVARIRQRPVHYRRQRIGQIAVANRAAQRFCQIGTFGGVGIVGHIVVLDEDQRLGCLDHGIVGIFAGLLWRLTGIGIGGIAAQVMDLLAKTTGPLALVSLGMSLIKFGIRGNLFAAVSLAALSLLAMPAVVYLLATTLFALPPLWFKVALLGASCPTGVNAYLIANYFKNAEGLASSTIVLALLGSLVTIPLWLSLVT